MTKVSLFIPCTVDLLLPDVGHKTVDLLGRLGCDLVYHPEQTCCGQVHYNSGYLKQAHRLARRFIDIFGDDEVVVSPSGSCVNMVKNHCPQLFKKDPQWLERARTLSGRVYELSQFIVDVLGIEDVGAAYQGRVAFHESCSLLYGLEVSQQPKKLIRAARGTELVAMNRADVCCGFGGKFSVAFPDISEALVADKAHNFIDSRADLLVCCDPGCLMNISGYLSRNHPDKRAMHIVDFLVDNHRTVKES